MENRIDWGEDLRKKFFLKFPNMGKAVFDDLLKNFVAGEGVTFDEFHLSKETAEDFERTFFWKDEMGILNAFKNLTERSLIAS
ncbi:MAG: hypothetical protein KAQ63_00875 [Candidatus Moranbacteria bacterium]|nr:hypothetical protein [Candidatus Moranbacteria bacterium]